MHEQYVASYVTFFSVEQLLLFLFLDTQPPPTLFLESFVNFSLTGKEQYTYGAKEIV